LALRVEGCLEDRPAIVGAKAQHAYIAHGFDDRRCRAVCQVLGCNAIRLIVGIECLPDWRQRNGLARSYK